MIGIEDIGVYIPDARIDNSEKLSEFEIDDTFLKTKTGMSHLARKASDDETSDLCCAAFEDLRSKTKIDTKDIDCVVVVTQNPDGAGLPHTSAVIHDKLDLPQSCAVFDVSLGCSGYVYGLSIIQSFMTANGFTKGILFTADPYSKIVDPADKNTALLFGDAATATLLSDKPKWIAGKFLFGSNGKERHAIETSTDSAKLKMNGRAVFSFSATEVPKNIVAMLEKNKIEIDAVDRFVLHQGSRFIIDTLQKRMSIDPDKMVFDAESYGNTVSSSIPVVLSNLKDQDNTIVIAGFGVGLSWGSTVLYKFTENGE